MISLNSLLPKDVVALSAEKMPSSFHPTLDCLEKEYHYYICYGKADLPHYRFYSWHYPYPLQIEEMRQAAYELIGSHDFSSFCNVKKHALYSHFIRKVNVIDIKQLENQRLSICIKGNQFLYKMVRNLAEHLPISVEAKSRRRKSL